MRRNQRNLSNILVRPGDVEQNPEQIYMCTPDNPFGRVIPELHQGPEILINDTELAAQADKASLELTQILAIPGEAFYLALAYYARTLFYRSNPGLQLVVVLGGVGIAISVPIVIATYGSKTTSESAGFVIPKEYKESGLGNVTIKEHGDRMNSIIETREWKENTGQSVTMEA